MATGKSNAMQGTGQSSSGENLKMQCTVSAGVMPPYQISRPLGIRFIPPYQMINRPLLYPFMMPYTTSFMLYVLTAHGPLHASNDDKRTEVLYQSLEVPLEQNVEAQQTLGGPSEEAVRSVIHDIIDDVNEIRSVPASPDLENNDVGHERNDEVNELVLRCPDLENRDVAPVCNCKGKETISHKDSSKIGCKASVRVRHDKDTNTYIVYDIILEHNHILHPTVAMYLRSHRKICTPEKAEILNMRSVENKADLKSMDTEAYLKNCSPFEKQAATIYTRSIFQKFQQELIEVYVRRRKKSTLSISKNRKKKWNALVNPLNLRGSYVDMPY
ncbi:hypothetical protein Taro_041328 [Colocasia esculenta]|uniref:Protein FAR1-RELATED SEQUENCE n=1 Tax=Colocasia esculenta TaxID=4460 RepID=A0A843WE36_COLES|nr:hypothetical protein [Colocasia esculenta]